MGNAPLGGRYKWDSGHHDLLKQTIPLPDWAFLLHGINASDGLTRTEPGLSEQTDLPAQSFRVS